jgi:hypothetical protein
MTKHTQAELALMGDDMDDEFRELFQRYDNAVQIAERDGASYAHMPQLYAARGAIINHINELAKQSSARERMIEQFYLMSELQMLMMPLMVHTYQEGFPSMTAQILHELWEWRNDKFNEAAKIVIPDKEEEKND